MGNINILCKVILNLKLEIDMGSFNDRKILQKVIYILQEMLGLKLDYQFIWYTYGPYSKRLTLDAFRLYNNFQHYNESAQTIFFTESAKEKIAEFKDFVGHHITDSVWLETIASMHFIATDMLNNSKDYGQVSTKLQTEKTELIEEIASSEENTDTYLENIWNEKVVKFVP